MIQWVEPITATLGQDNTACVLKRLYVSSPFFSKVGNVKRIQTVKDLYLDILGVKPIYIHRLDRWIVITYP